MTTKRKILLYIIGVLLIIYLGIYTVLTPFIRGVVVDETTRQPVENAWVMATATIGTRTIAGDTGGTFLISRPHLRTGKDGVFYIFPKLYPSIPTPFTFGNMKKNVTIIIRAMDGKRAEINLTKSWWQRFIFVSTATTYLEKEEKDIHYELTTLSEYCVTGGYSLVQTTGGYSFIQGGRAMLCDDWELDYTIAMHENFIMKVGESKSVKQDVSYVGAMGRLANLYEKKGENRKALETLIAVRDFEKQYNVDLSKYNSRISKIEEKLRQK